jgi:hypothetical protein
VVFDSLLDEHAASPPSQQRELEPQIFQAIISARKALKKMDPDDPEKLRLERRIAGYNNSLVKRRKQEDKNV